VLFRGGIHRCRRERDKEYISKVREGKRKESKIFDKQVQNKKSTMGEVIVWRYSIVKLPLIGSVNKKNTGMWNNGQGKTKRQRRLKRLEQQIK
jgi:hypothetical protein